MGNFAGHMYYVLKVTSTILCLILLLMEKAREVSRL